jgi:hypothetical protein
LEFLIVLKGSTELLAVRGGHAKLFQVELPPWLPSDTIQALITRFEKLLTDQIISMMERQQKQSKKHARKSSNQSTCLSDNEGGRSSFDSLTFSELSESDISDE